MRELFKSIMRFSWATLLLGVRESLGPAAPSGPGTAPDRPPATPALPTVAGTAPLEATSVAHRPSGPAASSAKTPSETPRPVNPGRLNSSTFITLGEGLAAGMGNFSLADDSQKYSFPALMAQQMGTPFDQPLMQPPGIGEAIGFAPWAVIVPSPLQSTVLNQIPPDPPSNLSVPGFTVSDALYFHPREPLVDRTSSKQTTANLILGVRGMAYATAQPLPTQLQSAVRRKPTLVLVELGYAEALEAAVSGNPDLLPAPESFREEYATIVKELRATGADVVVLTIPDPTDTAHFSTLQSASAVVKLDVPLLLEFWKLKADDLITANGLNEISFQLYSASVAPTGDSIRPLSPGAVLSAAVAGRIQSAIQDLNQQIRQIASLYGAVVHDLHGFIRQLRSSGAAV